MQKNKSQRNLMVQAIRRGELISLDNIARICSMRQCQPGDILEYKEDTTD